MPLWLSTAGLFITVIIIMVIMAHDKLRVPDTLESENADVRE